MKEKERDTKVGKRLTTEGIVIVGDRKTIMLEVDLVPNLLDDVVEVMLSRMCSVIHCQC